MLEILLPIDETSIFYLACKICVKTCFIDSLIQYLSTFISDYTLFKDVNREEIRKVNIVASMLLLSVCSILMAAVTKVSVHCTSQMYCLLQ